MQWNPLSPCLVAVVISVLTGCNRQTSTTETTTPPALEVQRPDSLNPLGNQPELTVIKAAASTVALKTNGGADVLPKEGIRSQEKLRVSVQFELDPAVTLLPPPILYVYRQNPNGRRTIMQTAMAEAVKQPDGTWRVDLLANPIHHAGDYQVVVESKTRRAVYQIAETTLRVVP